MHGGLLPNGGPLTMTHWVHRFMVLLTSLLVYSAIRQVFAAHKRGGEVKVLLKPAVALGAGILLQATIGASIVLLGRPLWMITLHNAVGAFTWSSAVALSTIAALWPDRSARARGQDPAGLAAARSTTMWPLPSRA